MGPEAKPPLRSSGTGHVTGDDMLRVVLTIEAAEAGGQ